MESVQLIPRKLKPIKAKFYNLSIRNKVYYLMVILLTLTITILTLSISSITRNRLITKTTVSTNQTLAMVSEKLSMLLERVKSDSIIIISSDQCQNVLKMVANEPISRYKQSKLIQSTLMSVFITDAIYKSIIYYDSDANSYTQDRTLKNDNLFLQHKQKLLKFIASKNIEEWISLHKSPYSERKGDVRDCISYLRKVYDKSSGKFIGIMEMEIEHNRIQDLYSTILGENIDIIITGSDGMIVSNKEADMLYKNVSEKNWYEFLLKNEGRGKSLTDETGNYFYLSQKYPMLDWQIIAKVPNKIFYKDVEIFTFIAIMIGVLLLLVTSVISRILAYSITKPIKNITDTVKIIAAGDYNQRVEVEATDEVGILSNEFNKMIDTTNQLMSRIVEEEKEKREYALSLLQMQMTPHFLYNILESICGLIVMDDKKTATKTINLVSNFYRGVLSKGREIVTIEDEIELSRYYLEVLKICQPNLFEYDIKVEPEINSCLITKLTLQPILENAIHHGIKRNGKNGIINIKGYIEEEKVIILVTDNGQGMTEETLERIQIGVSKRYRMDSFGLKNTDDRIKLYFGSEYGVSVSSIYGKGSEVRIELPVQKAGA